MSFDGLSRAKSIFLVKYIKYISLIYIMTRDEIHIFWRTALYYNIMYLYLVPVSPGEVYEGVGDLEAEGDEGLLSLQ